MSVYNLPILDTSYQLLWIPCMKYYSTFSGPFCLPTISQSTARTFWLLHVWSKLHSSFSWFQVRWQLLCASILIWFCWQILIWFQSTAWNWRLNLFYVFPHVHMYNTSFIYINMHAFVGYLLFHEVHVVFKCDNLRHLMFRWFVGSYVWLL